MFCRYCGIQMDETSSSCPGCGKPSGAPKAPQPSRTPLPYESHFSGTMRQGNQPGSRKGLLIGLVAAIVALVLLAGILAVVLLSGSDDTANTQLSQSEYIDQPQGTDAPPIAGDNPYANILMAYDSYVLPGSNSAYLSWADLTSLSPEALTIALNEIHARHGMTFSDPLLQDYFQARSWYSATSGTPSLNTYEAANMELLRVYIAIAEGTLNRDENRYLRITAPDVPYIFRTSSTAPISGSELKELSADKLCLARNEILARHGQVFQDAMLQEYFYTQDWYCPGGFEASALSTVERNNIALIEVYETIVSGDLRWSEDNPYRKIFYSNQPRQYILPETASGYLQDGDLIGMTADALCLARNEIFARNGYTFQSGDLLEYFLHQDWYTPNTPPGDASSIFFTQFDYANIDLLNSAENAAAATNDKIYRGAGVDLSRLDTSLNYQVSCDVFRVTLPAYFREHGVIDPTGNYIHCCEGHSYGTFGGHVFTFGASSFYDYYVLPSYRYLGKLVRNDSQEELDMIVLFPTDVQWCDPNGPLYSKMCNEIDRIVPTITGINGWTFVPAN